jgi:hypothetical protein
MPCRFPREQVKTKTGVAVRSIEQRFARDRKEVQSLCMAFFALNTAMDLRPANTIVPLLRPLDGSEALKQVLDLEEDISLVRIELPLGFPMSHFCIQGVFMCSQIKVPLSS